MQYHPKRRSRSSSPSAKAFERFSMQELIDRLEAHKVPCGRVRTIVDAIADAQVAARDMIVTLHDPELGDITTLAEPAVVEKLVEDHRRTDA